MYLVPKDWDGQDTNYHRGSVITRLPSQAAWQVPHNIDTAQFDFSWHPDLADPPYVYEFATAWHDQGGPVYTVPGAVDKKYVDIKAPVLHNKHAQWLTETECDFDYSWCPHPKDPAYNYVFGNQWYSGEVMPTVRYNTPGATTVKYMTHPRATLPQKHSANWQILFDCDWDYSWQPDPGDPPYIYVFGNQHWSAQKMPTVEYHVPGAVDRKYMDYPMARLRADRTHWTLPHGVDPDTVDFTWRPDPGEQPYVYQFATQHQKTGGATYTVPGATETKYLEHMAVQIKCQAVPIVEIDHLDGNVGQILGVVKRIRYFDNYRDTLIRLAKSLVGQYEHVWVCSSICDYTDFDFSWHPEQWQATMLHVFASDDQKFGDTFYMHVPTFAERAQNKKLLEWYSVNYVPRKTVPRRPMPVIEHQLDSHVDPIKHTDWSGPLALFTTNGKPAVIPTVSLWRQETKTVMSLSRGASAVIVPQQAKGSVKTQVYDYTYIDKTNVKCLHDQPLDIVFISNGECNAEINWYLLHENLAQGQCQNRVHRVDGVNGRVAAYHAAANTSTTPWFFAVFAKLNVNWEFDWSWQPDRMQQPKHYIFHARNPVNGLEYGHQAMIAYNRALTLANTGHGLDFTLDSAHEVVPMLSGTAEYAHTPWMAWRTAFREVIKLQASLPDVENQYRLTKWLEVDTTPAQWSKKGAEDAVEYYEAVSGDFEALRKSYEWSWLASYAMLKRGLSADV